MENNDNGKLEGLQHDLYKRQYENQAPDVHQSFTQKDMQVERFWRHDEAPRPRVPEPIQTPKKPFLKKVLIVAASFCVLCIGIALFMFFGGWNTISAKNVEIEFQGPKAIAAGNELDIDVLIKNKNSGAIDNATLYINYPDGTKSVEDLTKDLLNSKVEVGEVAGGATAKQTIKSVLYGSLNDTRDIKVTLTYGLKNSNATFREETDYSVTINATPLTVTVIQPQKAISNDTVEMKVVVTSNASAPLEDLLLKAEYPMGFTYVTANPKPDLDTIYWEIPVLKAGEKKEFTIRGQVQGVQGDERIFRFSIGAQDTNNRKLIATQYLSQAASIFVEQPPLAVSISLNSSTTPRYATTIGNQVLGFVDVVNNLPVRVEDAQVQLAFDGALYRAQTISPGNGYFQSSNNMIVWDKNTTPELGTLTPGARVRLQFTFTPVQPSGANSRNATMNLKATVNGRQVTDTSNSTMVASSDSKTVVTQSSVGMLSQATHSTGPFKNYGFMPPKADQKTSYTITWTATNSSNDVLGAEIRGNLPSNVKWLNAISPTNESVTWNPDQNEVVWRVGDLAAGTGSTKPARQVSFQVELQPSISQVGAIPDLVTNNRMTAIDSFTNATLSASTLSVTTRLPNDPNFSDQQARVIQ